MRELTRWTNLALALLVVSGCAPGHGDSNAVSSGRGIPAATQLAAVELKLTLPNALDTAAPILGRVYSGFVRDGRIFIANGADHEVLEYDTTGALVRRTGRGGRGPGEFARVRWIAPLRPDSLMVLDSELRRVSIFDATGTYARSFALAVPGTGEPQWIGEFGSGLAFSYTTGIDPRRLEEGGSARDSVIVVLIGRGSPPDSGRVEVLPALPGRWWRRVPATGGYRLEAVDGASSPAITVRGNTLLAFSSDAQQVRRWAGDRWQVIQLRGQAWDNGMVETAPAIRARLYDGMVVGPGGRFWLGDSRLGEHGLRTWRAFDSTGVLIATATLPAPFRPWEIAASGMLGRSEAEDGSEHVELWELVLPETEQESRRAAESVAR